MDLTSFSDQISIFMERFKENIRLFLEKKEIIKERDPGLEEHLNKAYYEWKKAQNYFNNATEPELIEHATYLIGAAERKYMYQLRRYKEEAVEKVT